MMYFIESFYRRRKGSWNAINLILNATPISSIIGGILGYSDIVQGSKELES